MLTSATNTTRSSSPLKVTLKAALQPGRMSADMLVPGDIPVLEPRLEVSMLLSMS